MPCKKCGSEEVKYVMTEETKSGYEWESECSQCGHEDTGYEFFRGVNLLGESMISSMVLSWKIVFLVCGLVVIWPFLDWLAGRTDFLSRWIFNF